MAAAAWTHALRRRAARDAGGELIGVGRVVTVVGAKGGVGTTTVATHLALAARELGEPAVCLVEYDLQAGDLRAFLDLPYRRSVVDLVPVADELTARHLTEALYTHASGLRVLLGPQEGEQAESGHGGRRPQHPDRDPHPRGSDDRRRRLDAERGQRDRRRDGRHGADRDHARMWSRCAAWSGCARCGSGSRSSRPRSRCC